jgi:hypothetical protein
MPFEFFYDDQLVTIDQGSIRFDSAEIRANQPCSRQDFIFILSASLSITPSHWAALCQVFGLID